MRVSRRILNQHFILLIACFSGKVSMTARYQFVLMQFIPRNTPEHQLLNATEYERGPRCSRLPDAQNSTTGKPEEQDLR